ncbi:MAG: MBOAT family protein [Flavobacteriales bacterium]|nr:MBOAT family protein [Flavobacteriales bacterium]
MLFNSIDFVVFLPIVFILYWWVGGNDLRRRNLILLIASYVFYGWWDPRFLVLIAFSTLLDYFVGVRLGSTSDARSRKHLLWTSLAVNLGLLGYFKYSNFFLESFVDAFSLFGQPFSIERLNIILPVGISFYTFQTLSYSIDVYRNKLQPTKDPVAFATYVSFFPQLVAGPIERAEKLLPQFASLRTFRYDMAVDGARQMLWGLFKKMVIADNCAFEVDRIFGQYHTLGGATLLLGSVLFAFQIYCDFSGYSDIAIGCARLFGFQLMKNFAFPYFSRDIAEFWRRWHISLSTWFRDYLYVPLGGSRGGTAMKVRNTFIIFIVSGFWHGANWTFLAWGALNAFFFLPLLLSGRNRTHLGTVAHGRWLPGANELVRMLFTFFLTCVAWVFFRARDMDQALGYLRGMFTGSYTEISAPTMQSLPYLLVFFLLLEWAGREHEHALERTGNRWPRLFRWSLHIGIVSLIGLFMATGETPFIYFQF